MLHLDPLAPRTPRLPHRRLGALAQLAASTALHMTLVVIAAVIGTTSAPGIDVRRAERITDQQRPDVRHFVFLAPELPRPGRGGGGGGNQRPDPIRRAQGVGADTITLRVRKEPPPTPPVTTAATPAVEDVPPIPSIVLDAKPLASGLFDQIGLPTGGVMSGTSTGPGSGGGVGTGSGTGMGSGRGPGFGPGSGGGTGGGIYRAGGAVSAPRLIKEVKPSTRSRRSQTAFKAQLCWKSSSRSTDARRKSVSSVRWTQGASTKKPWRPLLNGGSSPDVSGPRRSTCSSRSCSTSLFAEGCEASSPGLHTQTPAVPASKLLHRQLGGDDS